MIPRCSCCAGRARSYSCCRALSARTRVARSYSCSCCRCLSSLVLVLPVLVLTHPCRADFSLCVLFASSSLPRLLLIYFSGQCVRPICVCAQFVCTLPPPLCVCARTNALPPPHFRKIWGGLQRASAGKSGGIRRIVGIGLGRALVVRPPSPPVSKKICTVSSWYVLHVRVLIL